MLHTNTRIHSYIEKWIGWMEAWRREKNKIIIFCLEIVIVSNMLSLNDRNNEKNSPLQPKYFQLNSTQMIFHFSSYKHTHTNTYTYTEREWKSWNFFFVSFHRCMNRWMFEFWTKALERQYNFITLISLAMFIFSVSLLPQLCTNMRPTDYTE